MSCPNRTSISHFLKGTVEKLPIKIYYEKKITKKQIAKKGKKETEKKDRSDGDSILMKKLRYLMRAWNTCPKRKH